MKRFFSVFFIFLFLVYNANTIAAFAEPKTLTQGIYKSKDIGLPYNVILKVKNVSQNSTATIIIFDERNAMREFFQLDPGASDEYVRPLSSNSTIVIIGSGQVEFS
ncbi:hypothetical protein [Clostridium sp.]|uniref:hypothetical protein n=1 Tax=Clostridium sp. TaxID=1506 RepID=UPI0028447B7E|nr:hypothetical protein [Clostridium sp.]MDR3594442.1 hypothetical protein [Clostridium sp.]